MDMPSFDVVSEVDKHEVSNAVDQANRELRSRFDFRGVDARYERTDMVVRLTAQARVQLDQMLDILREKFVGRDLDPRVMEVGDEEHLGKLLHRTVLIREGITQDLSRKLVKMIKGEKSTRKLKVQASIQGDRVRITGKRRDDLQQVIGLLKDADADQPLQYINFRE